MTGKPRQIRETPEYTQQVSVLVGSTKRFDEITNGVLWGIARKPEMFAIPDASRPDIRTFRTHSVGDVPSYRGLFRYTDIEAVMLSIELAP